MKTSARLGAVLAGTVLPLSACFSYIPADLDTVPPGENVRVYVTPQGMTDVAELALENGPVLRGMVVRKENESLFLRIPVATRQEGFHMSPIGQDVRIPTREIIQLEQRRLDRAGTGLLVLGTAGAAAAVIFLIMDAFDDGSRPEEPGPDESRVPLFSLPLRR